MEHDFARKKSFVPDTLPWLVAGGALLFYLATVSRWLTPASLPLLDQLGGWSWPQYSLPPLRFLATLPFHFVPAGARPLALNLFTVACAALTLAQLARSVALLPHDRTQAERDRERSEFSLLSIRAAWLPPLLAVLACGLQLSFWENAVAATGEIFDLLLLAYVFRCVLEYRVDQRDSWLLRAAFGYGIGMADHWLLTGCAVFFAGALVWNKGVAFFNKRFLARLAAAWLAGISLCLLMPLLQSHSAGATATFWESLKFSLGLQKKILFALPVQQLLVLWLTSLLPLLLLSLRWGSTFGDTSQLGATLAAAGFQIINAVFMLVGLWIEFDPAFSPRVFPRQLGFGWSWLPLYYVIALCTGYYAGYFLLLAERKHRRESAPPAFLKPAVQTLFCVILAAVAAGLLWKNFPQIRAQHSDTLAKYADALVAKLPPRGGVLIADDTQSLPLAADALARAGKGRDFIFLNSYSLQFPAYHKFIMGKRPGWSDDLRTNKLTDVISPAQLAQFLSATARVRDVHYLHPSFGYYFEPFYAEPHGLTFALKFYPTNAVIAPAPADELISNNRKFYAETVNEFLPRIEAARTHDDPAARERGSLWQRLRPVRDPDTASAWIGLMLSHTLDNWGTTLQQQGRLAEAAEAFQMSARLNPENVAAFVNLGYNQKLARNDTSPLKLPPELESLLNSYRNWEQLLQLCGPVDEPQFTYQLGLTFAQGRLNRQAAGFFKRTIQLAPTNLPPRLWLAQIYNIAHLPDEALRTLRDARRMNSPMLNESGPLAELVATEATAYYLKQQNAKAEAVLQTAVDALPQDKNILTAAMRVSLSAQQITNALAASERLIKLNPDDPNALNNYGFILLQLKQYDRAIPPLTRVVGLQPNNSIALLNLAIAQLQAGHLDDAQKNYESLALLVPNAYQVYFGLGEIAYQTKDKDYAIENYSSYLSNAPPNTAEYNLVSARLKELKGK